MILETDVSEDFRYLCMLNTSLFVYLFYLGSDPFSDAFLNYKKCTGIGYKKSTPKKRLGVSFVSWYIFCARQYSSTCTYIYYTMIQWPNLCQSSITSHSGGFRDKLTLGFVCQQDCCRTSVGLSQTSISPTSLPKFALSISVCLLYHDVMGLNVVSVCACHRLTRAFSGCRCICFNITSLKVVSIDPREVPPTPL